MRTIRVRTAAPHDVHVGSGILRRLPALLGKLVSGRTAFLVTDRFLRRGPARRAASALRAAGWKVESYALPRGERAKSFEELLKLYGFLIRTGAERRAPLIAVGGGAVGDAAGFAAATYFRGIPLVQVPTTLLAQVDSAIGGKTAVNHPLAKNAVGAFHQPLFVLADVEALGSLPRRELLAGLGETAKYGLAFDPAFARWLGARWSDVLSGKKAALERVVETSVRWKASCVAADERDLSGRRELLNFGHTLGHALEIVTGFGHFLHGEAVAWGMRYAIELSAGRGLLRSSRGLAESLLARLPAPAWPAAATRARLVAALSKDKKVVSGRNVFVLLKEVGRPVRVADVSPRELDAAFDRMEARLGRRIR